MSMLGTVATIINKRSIAPRHEQRRIMRRELAEKQLRSEQRVAAQAEVKSLEAQQDVAVAEHAKLTGPIQEALTKLDNERLDAAADKKPLSNTWQKRRDAEQARLDEANLTLEKIVSEFRQRLKVAGDKLQVAQKREMEYLSTLPSDILRQQHLANPDLLIEATIAGSALEFAHKREARARQWLATVQDQVAIAKKTKNPNLGTEPGTLGFTLREADAVLTAATKAVAEAKRELDRVFQAIENE